MLKFIEFEKGEKRAHYVYEDGVPTIPSSNRLSAFEDAGINIPNTAVVVDFDNHDKDDFKTKKLKDIVDYFNNKYPTFIVETNSGYHLYYRKPQKVNIKNWNGVITTYGIPVDYKTGVPVTIKQNGKVRKSNKSFEELKFSTLPELPEELYPIIKSKNINMFGMGEGERDSSIYNHLLNVKETYLDVDIQKVGEFINNNLFLKPLSKKQLQEKIDNILNYKAKDNLNNYNGNPKDMISFAKWLVKKLDIKRYHTILYFFNDNKYSSDINELLREISKILPLKKSQDTEILHQLSKYAENINLQNENCTYIKLNNVYLSEDKKEDKYEIIPLTTGIFTPFNLDITYDENIYDEHVDKFLNDITCNRKELREFLEEIIGHILMINKFPHNIFFLTGSGKNGKSTFVTMLSNFAYGLTTHVSLSRFEDDTSIISLSGKLLNISDDINSSYIEKSEKLKLMSAGNTFDIRPNYRENTSFTSTSTFILTANEMPVFKDKSNGFYRRLLKVPFDFIVKERNGNLDRLLSTDNAKSYLLNLALKGLKRIVNNGYEMSENEIIKTCTEEYKLETDSLYAYLQEFPNIDNKWFTDVFISYETYCEDNSVESLPRNVFSRKIKNYGYYIGKQERRASTPNCISGRDKKIYKK